MPVFACAYNPAVQPPDLALLQQGDRAAWSQAFQWLYPTAFAVATNKLLPIHPAEIEDVALTTLEALVDKVATVKEVGELKKLAAAIAHNKSVDVIRKLPLPVTPPQRDDDDPSFDPPDPTSPFEALHHNELANLLGQCMTELKEQCRKLLKATFLDGLKQKEIADAMGMPMGSVGVNLSRCLKKLAEIAKRSGVHEEMRLFLG